jgi:3-oxoacyl-[acyl-carrier-protein] synthase II
MKRALITGVGVVTALGAGRSRLSAALSAGRTGIAPVTRFDTADCRGQIAAEVPGSWSGGRAEAFLHSALAEALTDAGLPDSDRWDLPPPLVVQGTAHGSLDLWLDDPEDCAGLPAQLGAGLWRRLGGGCEVATITSACVASTCAAGLALAAIRRGATERVLVAGGECLTSLLFRGFDSLRSLSRHGCRPFDRHRDGLVLGEGAAVLVVEEAQTARRRGAPVHAELAGFGAAADAHHLTAPDLSGKGAATALRSALADAALRAPPDYVNAHGTATVPNDRMEANALARAFGSDLGRIPISGTKAFTGHASGAAGVIELAICLDVLAAGRIPPTLGLEEPDPCTAGHDLVHGDPRERDCAAVVSINSAFGGNNAAVVLRRCS